MPQSDKRDDGERSDLMQVAGFMAHQLKSPISAAASLLNAILGEYAGPLTPRQKRMLERMDACLDESLAAMRRMLEIVNPEGGDELCRSVAEVQGALNSVGMIFRQALKSRNISFSTRIPDEPTGVHISEAALTEVLTALLSNAVKYTPDHGEIRINVEPASASGGMVAITIHDSGIGIPKENLERVFEPFFRAGTARNSDRPGVGLGLAFVHTVTRKAGGRIRAGKSELGGARMTLELPPASLSEASAPAVAEAARFRVVIVGGVAAGPKAASKIIRLLPDADVTVIEKGKFLAYAGCGLPYYVSGGVQDDRTLMCTPLGAVRDSVFFQKVKHVHVKSLTEALEIDRAHRRVRLRDCVSGAESWAAYDKLLLATGASPIIPSIPGIERHGVYTLHGVHDAEGIRAACAEGKARDVVIIGGGLVGVEMTEALVDRGCRVTIVELEPQVLHMLDWEMAHLVEKHMELKGVKILTGTRVLDIEAHASQPERVGRVRTNRGTFPVDMVILAVGVRPNVELAQRAGLDISEKTSAITVDEQLRTSDPDIYAAGDCVECRDLVTGRPVYIPLGSTATKQGRIAAINICGGEDTFPGVLGSTVCKVFDYCVARTGLTEAAAREMAYDVITVLAPAPDKAHYMPTARELFLKIVVERETGRLLGAQAVGPGDGVKRIDVAAMAVAAGMTVHELANADLCYAPPYAPAMDNLITAANIARNKLSGAMRGISAAELHAALGRGEDWLLLDLRTPREHEEERLPGAKLMPLASLRGRLQELPGDKTIVTFCNISLRGYEGALILRAAGFRDVRVLDGGLDMWPYEKEYAG